MQRPVLNEWEQHNGTKTWTWTWTWTETDWTNTRHFVVVSLQTTTLNVEDPTPQKTLGLSSVFFFFSFCVWFSNKQKKNNNQILYKRYINIYRRVKELWCLACPGANGRLTPGRVYRAEIRTCCTPSLFESFSYLSKNNERRFRFTFVYYS